VSTRRPGRFTKKQLADARRQIADEEARFAEHDARQAAREHIISERRARSRKALLSRALKLWISIRIPVAVALLVIVATYSYRVGRFSACEEEQLKLAGAEYEKLPAWVFSPVTYEEALALVPNVPVDVLQNSQRDGGYVVGDMYESAIGRLQTQLSAQPKLSAQIVLMVRAEEVVDYFRVLSYYNRSTDLESFASACEEASWFGTPMIPEYVGKSVFTPWPAPYFANEGIAP
jgi:hypothetical protein